MPVRVLGDFCTHTESDFRLPVEVQLYELCFSPVSTLYGLVIAPFKAVTMVPATALKYIWSCIFYPSGGSEHLAPTLSAAQYLGRGLRAPSLPLMMAIAPVGSELSGLNKTSVVPRGRTPSLGLWSDWSCLAWLWTAPPALHWQWGMLRRYPQLSSGFFKWLWCSLGCPISGLKTEALNTVRNTECILVEPGPVFSSWDLQF